MDSAVVQTLVAGLIVLAAVVFLGRRAWRTLAAAKRSGSTGAECGSGGACGCDGAASATKGERVPPAARP